MLKNLLNTVARTSLTLFNLFGGIAFGLKLVTNIVVISMFTCTLIKQMGGRTNLERLGNAT